MKQKITIGTRGSKLALWQADWVASQLSANRPDLDVHRTIIKTKGDKILDVPLAKIGGKGLFVKEIEDALLDGRIDIAVHSMKDMPAELPEGLTIGPIPEREDPRDVLVSKNGHRFTELPPGASIGTSSLRRSAQLQHFRPDLCIVPLRGNLDTRLKKLETQELDAIVLAAAGICRLGLEERITEYLDPTVMLPAVAQGALCIEIRKNDSKIDGVVSCLNHAITRRVVMGERAFLKQLGGSCQVPVAGYGHIVHDRFTISGLVAELDGSRVLRQEMSGEAADACAIGVRLAGHLLDQGARGILERVAAEGQQ